MSNFQKSDKSARIRKDIMIYIDSRINQVLYNLDHFTHKDFENEILRTGIDMSINSSSRILARLIACQLIIRYKRDHYQTIKENLRFEFQYDLSFEANTIHQSISKTYPLITYQIWNLTVLNQFVYHLFGHNCIFVEVESNLEERMADESKCFVDASRSIEFYPEDMEKLEQIKDIDEQIEFLSYLRKERRFHYTDENLNLQNTEQYSDKNSSNHLQKPK